MSEANYSQPVFSRSAKILFVGLAQFFIMGYLMASVAMVITASLESPDFDEMSLLDGSMNITSIFLMMIGIIFTITGTITLIVSGIVYLIDRRKGIKFATPKHEPVSVTRQTIYAIIPLMDMYAAFKIKKFWIYVLIITGASLLPLSLTELNILPGVFPYDILIQEAILLPISIMIIRIFSKRWNKQFSETNLEEIN